jgi:hypothetical protein
MKLNKVLSATMCLFMLLSAGCASKGKDVDTSSNSKQVAKVEEPKRNINVETAIKYIQSKDYDKAYENLKGFEKSTDEEGKNLLSYVIAIRYIRPIQGETEVTHNSQNVYMAKQELKKISSSYSGALSTEFKSLVSAIDAKPSIGMNRYEVILSSWSKPSKINKTTTASGVKEQWVYSGNKYLYLENDILTAIQE